MTYEDLIAKCGASAFNAVDNILKMKGIETSTLSSIIRQAYMMGVEDLLEGKLEGMDEGSYRQRVREGG